MEADNNRGEGMTTKEITTLAELLEKKFQQGYRQGQWEAEAHANLEGFQAGIDSLQEQVNEYAKREVERAISTDNQKAFDAEIKRHANNISYTGRTVPTEPAVPGVPEDRPLATNADESPSCR
jgi:hypothetical protein